MNLWVRLGTCFLLVLSLQAAYAQPSQITVTGQVLDSAKNVAIPYATIALIEPSTNKVIGGTTTNDEGRFRLPTKTSDIEVEISFIGYAAKRIKNILVKQGIVNLGTVSLVAEEQFMNEVTVVGEKSTTEFKLDKRVFNVGKDISSTGMGALEVLNNVPSVTVDIEGQISLRGSSGVQILINGKPSVLADEGSNALGSITADMIEKIEVITNPSAKYDAEGTSGILNIVLKKEEKKGVNGSFSLNTGSPANHSIGLSLNSRTEKFNLFTQMGAGYRSLPREGESINRDLIRNTEIAQESESFRNEQFYNIALGSDYYMNPLNTLTLSGSFAYEIEDQPSEIRFDRVFDQELQSSWSRFEETDATNPKWQYELQYEKQFSDDKEHKLLFSGLGRFFGKDLSSAFDHRLLFGTESFNRQQITTKFQQADYTFKMDYTDPISENLTIESGTQYVFNDVGNDYEVLDLVDEDWIIDSTQTNNFEYDQEVLGVYATAAYEKLPWGLKLGLRMERTNLNTLLTNTNESNHIVYTNLFPSAHASVKATQKLSFQMGYSKRIFRPRLWHLNPFFNIRNNFNVRLGNPDLLPSFTDSYEVTAILETGWISLNAGVFHRYTEDVIERVSFFDDGRNVSRPLNIGTNKATGVELNAKYSPVKWVSLNGDINYNRFAREGAFETTSFDFQGNRWSAKLMTKLNLPKNFDFELNTQYLSAYKTVQGKRNSLAFADLGLRKKVSDGKVIFNLGIRDVFASRRFVWTTEQSDFFLSNSGFRGRYFTFGFSYGFGKGEAMTYSGRRHR